MLFNCSGQYNESGQIPWCQSDVGRDESYKNNQMNVRQNKTNRFAGRWHFAEHWISARLIKIFFEYFSIFTEFSLEIMHTNRQFTVNDECYFVYREVHEVRLILFEVFDFELLVFRFLLRDARFLPLNVDQILPKIFYTCAKKIKKWFTGDFLLISCLRDSFWDRRIFTVSCNDKISDL